MYALDSDTLTLALQGSPNVVRRIFATPPNSLWLPAVVVEERLRGRLAFLSSLNPSRAADSLKIPAAYDLLPSSASAHATAASPPRLLSRALSSSPATPVTSSLSPVSAPKIGASNMKRNFLCFALLFSLTGPCLAQAARGPFAAVPPQSMPFTAADTLQKADIPFGYSPGTYTGRRAVSRYEFALFTGSLLADAKLVPFTTLIPKYYPTADYAALLRRSPPAQKALLALVKEFAPELNRLGIDTNAAQSRLTEMAQIAPVKPFPDVPQTHWASRAVQSLQKKGLMLGYPDGKYFCPE